MFLKLGLHRLFLPFYGLCLNLAYISKFSKWRKNNSNLGFNDFYNNDVKYSDRFKLHDFIYNKEKLDKSINYFEFGVGEGVSFKWWVNKNKNESSKFYGFDTFTGLPEDFGVMKKNDYDTKGQFPDVNNDKRVSFISGMFQASLHKFLSEYSFNDNINVIHLDADLYSSTLYVLTQLRYKLKKGDIILFDEFGVPTHEFKAWDDFISAYQLKYEVLGAVNNYLQIAVKIL